MSNKSIELYVKQITVKDIFRDRPIDEYSLCCGAIESSLSLYADARRRVKGSASELNKLNLQKRRKEFFRLVKVLKVLKAERGVSNSFHNVWRHYIRRVSLATRKKVGK